MSDPGVMVKGIIDGDTIVVEPKTRVRLRHLDAPKLEYCGGKEAKEALEKLVRGKRVRLTSRFRIGGGAAWRLSG